jgi:penicillin amidase
VGYRIVREFRQAAIERAMAPLGALLQSHDPEFRLGHVARQMEYPAWAMLEARPDHLLNPDFTDWRALELAALDTVLAPMWADGNLDNDTWGAANRVQIRHPLAGAFAPVDWWLSMPADEINGDSYLPRVQHPRFGASERFAVSPGREASAYFHMATGQSAHPLSPFFGKGHEDWVEGRPTPWLPGAPAYTLTLTPR